jgi:hypothetical protein
METQKQKPVAKDFENCNLQELMSKKSIAIEFIRHDLGQVVYHASFLQETLLNINPRYYEPVTNEHLKAIADLMRDYHEQNILIILLQHLISEKYTG